ncbi:MAG: uracil-DNA glycosylase [Treponema sp.]|nr:uracil-DNA glycosylase [Treponema sp.]
MDYWDTQGEIDMTTEQKKQIAESMDMINDYLRDGYKRYQRAYQFTDDEQIGSVKSVPKEVEVERIEPQSPVRQGLELSAVKPDSIEAVGAEARSCTRCGLHRTRTQAVPGEGVKRPLVLVVGEGPGADEDATGSPFVGQAGQLLDKMLGAVNLSRKRNCFIINVVKCRPPHNRDPLPEEIASCAQFTIRQLKVLKPAVILCVGRIAAQAILNTTEGIGKLRGVFTEYMGFPLLPTYHPSALLRNEALKRPAWEDMKALRTKLIGLDEHYALEIQEGT